MEMQRQMKLFFKCSVLGFLLSRLFDQVLCHRVFLVGCIIKEITWCAYLDRDEWINAWYFRNELKRDVQNILRMCLTVMGLQEKI